MPNGNDLNFVLFKPILCRIPALVVGTVCLRHHSNPLCKYFLRPKDFTLTRLLSRDPMPNVWTPTLCLLAGVAGGRGRVATPLSHLVLSIDRTLHPCIYQSFLNLIGRENHINVTFKEKWRGGWFHCNIIVSAGLVPRLPCASASNCPAHTTRCRRCSPSMKRVSWKARNSGKWLMPTWRRHWMGNSAPSCTTSSLSRVSRWVIMRFTWLVSTTVINLPCLDLYPCWGIISSKSCFSFLKAWAIGYSGCRGGEYIIW